MVFVPYKFLGQNLITCKYESSIVPFFFLEENSSTSVNMMPNKRGKEKKVVPAVKAAGRVGGSQCWLDEDRMINYS